MKKIFNVFKDGVLINSIVADEDFLKAYCTENRCTYAENRDVHYTELSEATYPTPTEAEQLRADMDFLAAMTGVIL